MFALLSRFFCNRVFLLCCFFVFCSFAYTSVVYLPQNFADSLNTEINRKLATLANEGYPFAEISPEISIKNDSIKVNLHINKGNFVADARPLFFVEQSLREHLFRRPIEKVLSDRNHFVFSDVSDAVSLLQSRRYVRNAQFFAPQLNAGGDFYDIPILVRAHSSAFFSGGIGLSTFPRTQIVGNANLDIINPLGFGESFDFSFMGEEDFFRIATNLEIPYFFNTPFDLLFSATAEIGNEDYAAVELSAGLRYMFRRFWSAGLMAVYNELVREDTTSRYTGVRAILENTPQRLQRGVANLRLNTEVESGVLLYQNRRQPKANILANSAFHIPIRSTATAFLTKPSLGLIAFRNPENLHLTQKFRLGGANSIRGYQESIFSALAFGSLANEFRFYIDNFSAIYVLADYAAFVRNEYSFSAVEHIFGYGVGLTLPLRNVNFSLEWARNIRDEANFGRLHFRISTF